MKQFDFSKTLIRSSSTSAIMTEPKEKAAKDAGELSKTTKTHLVETYIREVYGREPMDIQTKQMKKGTNAEGDGIAILAKYKGVDLVKNTLCIENAWQQGHPDVFQPQGIDKPPHIIDTKLSWSIWTFLANVLEPIDKGYWWQIQSYMSLTGALTGEVAYILLSCPENILQDEKYRLLRQMDVATEESPEFRLAAAKLELSLTYPDIPIEERVLIFPVVRDDEAIAKINEKVVRCRQFLQEFSEKHLNFNKIIT
jgi:hypothetical protein